MYIPKQIAVSHFDRTNRALCLELFHGSPTVLRCLSFRKESIRLDSEIYRSDCHLDYDLIGLAIDFISSSNFDAHDYDGRDTFWYVLAQGCLAEFDLAIAHNFPLRQKLL